MFLPDDDFHRERGEHAPIKADMVFVRSMSDLACCPYRCVCQLGVSGDWCGETEGDEQ